MTSHRPHHGTGSQSGTKVFANRIGIVGPDAKAKTRLARALEQFFGAEYEVGITGRISDDLGSAEASGHAAVDLLLVLDNADPEIPNVFVADQTERSIAGDLIAVIEPDDSDPSRDSTAGRGQPRVPHFRQRDIGKIGETIIDYLRRSAPPLSGVVLAGGKSTRMGVDKSGIGYHGRPQLEIAADLLAGQCDRVYISVAAEPQKGTNGSTTLSDRFIGFGPSGGILTALHERPDSAWMVLGCDLPLMTADDLSQLVDERDALRPATAFRSPSGDLPEPLAAIYEPRMLSLFHQAFAMDITCPRKVLIRSRARLVTPGNPEAVMNANTPADRDRVSAIIRGHREE